MIVDEYAHFQVRQTQCFMVRTSVRFEIQTEKYLRRLNRHMVSKNSLSYSEARGLVIIS